MYLGETQAAGEAGVELHTPVTVPDRRFPRAGHVDDGLQDVARAAHRHRPHQIAHCHPVWRPTAPISKWNGSSRGMNNPAQPHANRSCQGGTGMHQANAVFSAPSTAWVWAFCSWARWNIRGSTYWHCVTNISYCPCTDQDQAHATKSENQMSAFHLLGPWRFR